ncbi:MAG: DUF4411 family protein [Sedimentisphaerales bacterium]|nr:DUF4411 family protein [Sedimentisphaerales bacterium]
MKYCIDTSSLIDAWVRWYSPEVFPGLWKKVDDLIAESRFISSEEVLQELERKEGDTLYLWAKERQGIFIPLDEEIQKCVNIIMSEHPTLVDGRTGKSFADPWVVATARVKQCTVITGEQATRSLNRPKIPDVCESMKIDCISFSDLLLQEKWRFF